MRFFFFMLLLLSSIFIANAQNHDTTIFNSPNVSYRFDTTKYYLDFVKKFENQYFSIIQDKGPLYMYSNFQISATNNYPDKNMNQETRQTVFYYYCRNNTSETYKLLKMSPLLHANGFTYFWTVGTDSQSFANKSKQIPRDTPITCIHFWSLKINKDGFCSVDYAHNKIDKNTDVTEDSIEFCQFLTGIQIIPQRNLQKEDSILRNSIEIGISPVTNLEYDDSLKGHGYSYGGYISVNARLGFKIMGAVFNDRYGKSIYYYKNSRIRIYFKDYKTGNIQKSGNLIVLDHYGRLVEVPISFSYFNK